MGYYCTVPQCTSLAGKSKNVKFHRFPREENMAEKWNEILKRGKPYTKYSKVCSLHFRKDDYNVTSLGSMKTLSKDAIPSQNLPKCNPDGTVMTIRKPRTTKPKGRESEWNNTLSSLSSPGQSGSNLSSHSIENNDSVLRNRLNCLNVQQHNIIKPKQDAFMQTEPLTVKPIKTEDNSPESYINGSESSFQNDNTAKKRSNDFDNKYESHSKEIPSFQNDYQPNNKVNDYEDINYQNKKIDNQYNESDYKINHDIVKRSYENDEYQNDSQAKRKAVDYTNINYQTKKVDDYQDYEIESQRKGDFYQQYQDDSVVIMSENGQFYPIKEEKITEQNFNPSPTPEIGVREDNYVIHEQFDSQLFLQHQQRLIEQYYRRDEIKTEPHLKNVEYEIENSLFRKETNVYNLHRDKSEDLPHQSIQYTQQGQIRSRGLSTIAIHNRNTTVQLNLFIPDMRKYLAS